MNNSLDVKSNLRFFSFHYYLVAKIYLIWGKQLRFFFTFIPPQKYHHAISLSLFYWVLRLINCIRPEMFKSILRYPTRQHHYFVKSGKVD